MRAGYDTRAGRLEAAASCDVYEVDHPATQIRKRRALGSVPGNVRYVPLDFERDSLSDALASAGLAPQRRTWVLWEGVFSYLTSEAIDDTLGALRRTCAPGSQVVLTYVDQRALDSGGEGGEAWMDAVSGVGEPLRTGLDPAAAGAFFAARGFVLLEDESTAQAAVRLGVRGAEKIPDFYRLASLELSWIA